MNKFIENILQIPAETLHVEFKRLGEEKIVEKVIQTITAFANTEGGTIFLGIDDPEKTKLKGLSRIFGIEENLEIFDFIGREISKIIPPLTGIWPPQKITISEIGKTVAIACVPKAEQSFRSIHNHVYVRLEKGNKRLNPQEIVKFSYAKGFEKADRELVDVDFELLDTETYKSWKNHREISEIQITKTLFNVGLARKDDTDNLKLKPTRAAVMLFADHPTHLMETKCCVRVLQYEGTIEKFGDVPNLVGTPKTVEGPAIKLIKETHEYVLTLLRAGIRIRSGFVTQYRIPERAIKEAITNAVIHRDYHIKRDIEIRIFEDRVEIDNPGLFPYNITRFNIGYVRADGYRNDLLVKHLREFPIAPNFDQNEGVRAIRAEMHAQNLYPPIYVTYPIFEDSVKTVLFNEIVATEWDKVQQYLTDNKFITNQTARKLTKIADKDTISKMLKRWVHQGLLTRIDHPSGSKKLIKYKLATRQEIPEQKGLFDKASTNKK